MNFAYGVIAAVGVLIAISLGLIAAAPNDIIEPRAVSMEEKPTVCTMQWDPMCGVDGETYGNSCMLDAADVKLDYPGECVVEEPMVEEVMEEEPKVMEKVIETVVEEELVMEEEPIMEEPVEEVMEEPVEEVMEEPEASSMSLTISIPKGTGVPGCETTQECYLPYEVTVDAGTTVTWSNGDTTVHTVTSGTPGAGVTGLFDSSIFNPGEAFQYTFDEAGTYDYFCMVHPWMEGIVHVN